MKLIPISQTYKCTNSSLNFYAMVDDDDFEYLNKFKWSTDDKKAKSVSRRFWDGKKWTRLRMRREIMKAKKGQFIDHIDINPFNNQKSNLRFCSISQNSSNIHSHKDSKSKYLGVHLSCNKYKLKSGEIKISKRWRASLTSNGESIHLGMYATEAEAAKSYNEGAKKHHGEFSNPNTVNEYTING